MNNSAKIKMRLLEVAKNKGISYEKFFKDFGNNYGNFRGKSLKSALRSDVLVDFSAKHPEVDLHWIITGKEKNDNSIEVNTLNEPRKEYTKGETDKMQFLKEFFNTDVEGMFKEMKEIKAQNNTIIDSLERMAALSEIERSRKSLEKAVKEKKEN